MAELTSTQDAYASEFVNAKVHHEKFTNKAAEALDNFNLQVELTVKARLPTRTRPGRMGVREMRMRPARARKGASRRGSLLAWRTEWILLPRAPPVA